MSTDLRSPLRQLADLISESVDKIDASFAQNNLQFPSLDEPLNPTSSSEAAAMSPDVIAASMVIVGACAQLSASVNIPALTLYGIFGGFNLASCMRVALESNIIEILRENPEGLHVTDIAALNGMHPNKISRVLRLLATHHVFIEIAPDTFRNNRLSSIMDSTKTLEDIKAKPEDKHVGTSGLGAGIELTTDEVFKASAYMTEVLLDPSKGHSDAVEDSPMNYAFKYTGSSWDWYEEPGNELRLKRFTAAMHGSTKTEHPDGILHGFRWGDLPPKSVVVDVGGGLGHVTMRIAREYPDLRYIVQDRLAIIEQAEEHWQNTLPAALVSGTVKLQTQDFFSPQPIKDASVFFCRSILHDYSKANAVKILKNLRDAATDNTKLIIIERIVQYACETKDIKFAEGIIGAGQPTAPKPLLPNFGKANAIAYLADVMLYVGFNGEERTLGSFIDLTKTSGWKITHIFRIPGSGAAQIVAVPA